MRSKLLHSILNYLNDKLSNKERHDLEKEVNTDPFLQDAMDGFENLNAKDLESDLILLQNKLTQRKSKPKKSTYFFKYAAAITLLMGIGSIALYITNTKIIDSKLAEEIHTEEQKEEFIVPNTEPKIDKLDETIIEIQEEIEIENEPKVLIEESQKKQEIKYDEIIINEEYFTESNPELILEEEVEEEYLAKVEMRDNKVSKANAKAKPKPSSSVMASRQPAASARVTNEVKRVSGTVFDENNQPLVGANIMVSESKNGTITDIDGNFTINTTPDDTIQIAYIGYKSEEYPVDSFESGLTTQLTPELLALEEVVVVGYGVQKKSVTTGSVSRIEASDISGTPPEFDRTPTVYKARAVKIDYKQECDTSATPKIGWKEYKKYLKRNFDLTYNQPTKVIVSLTINSTGEIKEISIIDAPNDKFKERTIDLINDGCKWDYAVFNNEPVGQIVTITIKF